MSPLRKKAIAFLAAAIGSAAMAFYALFVGGTNHFIAGGVAVLGLIGFWILYSRGFDLWMRDLSNAPGSGASKG